MNTAPPITQLQMTAEDIEMAERAAKRIGFTQTAYTSTSGLWGLFCLPDQAGMKEGCFIKTREFGMLFVSDLEDLKLYDLAEEERQVLKSQDDAAREVVDKVLGEDKK